MSNPDIAAFLVEELNNGIETGILWAAYFLQEADAFVFGLAYPRAAPQEGDNPPLWKIDREMEQFKPLPALARFTFEQVKEAEATKVIKVVQNQGSPREYLIRKPQVLHNRIVQWGSVGR